VVAKADVVMDSDKHSETNGHSPSKNSVPEVVEKEREKPSASPVKEAKKEETTQAKQEKTENKEIRDEEKDEPKSDDTEADQPTDKVDGKEDEPVAKKSKEKPIKTPKPKVVKEPSAPRAPRERKPKISGDAAIGELDNSVAEQVKSDGLRRERKQVERFVPVVTPGRDTKAGVVEEGRGTKLGDMEYTTTMINVSS
jgi:hypothetical protein